MKRIGLFGGSFDPVHTGHVEAVHSFLNSGLIDEIWVIPTPDPPHKRSSKLTAFAHRKRMLQLAFQDLDRIEISDIESGLSKPSYTLQTIRHLKKIYPEYTFYLCLGEDSLQSFHRWHKYREILEECTLLVVDRPGFNHNEVDNSILERTILVDHQPVNISSTDIRDARAINMWKSVPKKVQEYIHQNSLYEEKT